MIAADTSVFICYLQHQQGTDIELLREYLRKGEAWFPPAVVTELASGPKLEGEDLALILSLPMLEVYEGFWQRAGEARRSVMQTGRKCKLGDALIAQSCIDHDMPLLTRDEDFRHFVTNCSLKLALPFR